MKLSKVTKKVLAIVMALAMIVVGNYFMPTSKSVDAETSWINVTNMPTTAYANKGRYTLGTTSDTSGDGKWDLEVGQNQWRNWKARYKNADQIEGFIFDDQVYNNAFGCNLWTCDLTDEYNLTPGQVYNMSVTINYSGVNAAQPNIISTEGGTINMGETRTVAAGTSSETYTAQVKLIQNQEFRLKIVWAKNYNTAELGTLEIADVSFTEPPTETVAPGDWLTVGTLGSKYRLGVGSDGAENGLWYFEAAQNSWGNYSARYKYADRFEGFTLDSTKANDRGGVYIESSDLKEEYGLNANQKYKMTVTLDYDSGQADGQNNFITTNGGSMNMDEARTVEAGESQEVYTADVIPSDNDFILKISWTNSSYEYGGPGVITVTDISFTDPETETVQPGDWINVGHIGAQYRLGTTSDDSADGNWYLETAQNSWGNWKGRYKNADSFEGFTFENQAYHDRGGVFITSEDLVSDYSLVNGRMYNMSVTINYTGVGLKENPEEEPASQENTILTTGGVDNMNITRTVAGGNSEETYEAKVMPGSEFALKIIWAAQDPENPEAYTTAEKGTIEVTDISFEQIGTACEIGTWAFADAPENDGWQYFVHGAGSTYSGGTSMNNPLTINYGPYVPDQDYSCMARSPITTVVPGQTCTGSISITSDKRIAGSGDAKIVNAALYAYDESTGQESWLTNSDNAPDGQDVSPNTKTTFEFSYTAPDTGKIFYVLTTSYTPPATIKFEATHDGPYDVSEYKPAGGPITYPTQAGKVFAGWFTDNTYTTPYTEDTGYAYAKFIDEKVLSIKFQTANDGSAVRFVSSLDSMDYQEVGFNFTGTYNEALITEKTKTTNRLYNKITADGESITPEVFSDESQYFFTYTVRGMTNASTASTWNVTPFFVTLDGTTVTGSPREYPES